MSGIDGGASRQVVYGKMRRFVCHVHVHNYL